MKPIVWNGPKRGITGDPHHILTTSDLKATQLRRPFLAPQISRGGGALQI